MCTVLIDVPAGTVHCSSEWNFRCDLHHLNTKSKRKMSQMYICFVLIAIIFRLISPTCIGSVSSVEYFALYALYNSTDGPHWLPSQSNNWNFTGNLSSPCSDYWKGVNCTSGFSVENSTMECVVSGLNLFRSNLNGYIPPEVGNFIYIESLELKDNFLAGSIPSTIGVLSMLRVLNLGDNLLTGSIPSIQLATRLQELNLFDNFLTGSTPSNIQGLTLLLEMSLYGNLLTGPIPSCLGDLPLFQLLDVYLNFFTGAVPPNMGKLEYLNTLTLENNYFSGSISSEIYSAVRLESLLLESNVFSGSLASSIGKLAFLRTLTLNNNFFTGNLPTELGMLTELSIIIIFNNSFSGSIPTEIGQMTAVTILSLGYNLFSGHIPTEISSLRSLFYLTAELNLLSGPLPSQLGALTLLSSIQLSRNRLTSSLPSDLSSLAMLKIMAFDSCFLSGSVPSEYALLNSLALLNLTSNLLSGDLNLVFDARNISSSFKSMVSVGFGLNFFSGSLPSGLFSLPRLGNVVMYSNCFQGKLPSTICEASLLTTLILDALCSAAACVQHHPLLKGVFPYHFMSGSIPGCVWSLPRLTTLHLSGNGLVGSLPPLVFTNRNLSSTNFSKLISSLYDLNLGNNALTGTIPESFQTYGKFMQLDLSSNKLSGTLVPHFAVPSSSKLKIDLSANRLSGNVPKSFVDVKFGINILDGNLFQCNSNTMPASDPNSAEYVCGSSDFNSVLEFWISAFLASFIFILLFFACVGHDSIEIVGTSDNNKNVWSSRIRVASIRLATAADHRTLIRRIQSYLESYSMLHASLSQSLGNCSGFLSQLLRCCVCLVLLATFYVLVCMASFIALKLNGSIFSTHLLQYTWVSTSAFLHGSIPAALVLFYLFASVFLIRIVMFIDPHNVEDLSTTQLSVWCRRIILCIGMQLFIIMITLVVNISYVYIVLRGLSLSSLTAIQFSLGIIKLTVSSALAPWLIRQLTFLSPPHQLQHRVFASVFIFIASPVVATFFTASDCFRGGLLGESMVTSTFLQDFYQCYIICDGAICSTKCVFLRTMASSVISPAWIYSYQCSSQLLVNYIPVIILTYLISGILMPLGKFIYTSMPVKYVDMFMPATFQQQFLANSLYFHNSNVQLKQNFDEAANDKDLCSVNGVLSKMILNVAVLITFGLSCPLLSIVVAIDGLSKTILWRLLIKRYLSSISLSGNVEEGCRILEASTLHSGEGVEGCLWIVIVFASIFWSLNIFDMIGDLYGNTVATLVLIVPAMLAPVAYSLPWIFSRVNWGPSSRSPILSSISILQLSRRWSSNSLQSSNPQSDISPKIDNTPPRSKSFEMMENPMVTAAIN